MDLKGKKIAILASHGFEQSELEVPLCRLKEAGAEVHVVSPEQGEIKGWAEKDWGQPVTVDRSLDQTSAAHYDALVLPGGQINPDLLRVNRRAIDLIKSFYDQGKVVAAICHAPWLLIEAGLLKGRRATSYPSIRTDVINAGAQWEDSPVVADHGLITSRNPGDVEAFSNKIIEEVTEGKHRRARAA
jgi:protease I